MRFVALRDVMRSTHRTRHKKSESQRERVGVGGGENE